MNKILVLLVMWVASLFPISDTQALDFQGRDLSRYDLDGPYSLDRSSRHAEDQPVLEAAIRAFLWSRWHEHRLAHLSLVQYSLEGLPTREWYFVEPDEHGIWRIIREQDITLPAVTPGNPEEHLRQSRRHEIYFLERVAQTEKDDASAKPLADDDRRPSTDYRVRLKNKKGELISEL